MLRMIAPLSSEEVFRMIAPRQEYITGIINK